MRSAEIRKRFIDYFIKNGHEHVPSSRLTPENDPTLLFTNSGMVQFKNVFLGFDKRPYKRATTAQKCVRAGGKHNDLENVGHTARHHTFFEMLGNFSFGDYFKKDAIRFAWDFLTNDLKIPKNRLFVTVFTDDDDAYEIWNKQEKVSSDKISRFGDDNFWQMGDTGPCGPCSEIFYDHGAENGCGKPDCKVGCSCDRFVEIWNLVFMQYNKDSEGKTTPLPKPSIDTGMGLERMCAVMQGVASNYETDIFTDLFKVMEKETGKHFVPGDAGNTDNEVTIPMKVMADHSRCAAFLIADGVVPSNEGHGYVLRRIMRRAIRFGRKLSNKSVMIPTVKEVIKMMSSVYPELKERETFILSTIETEETRFNATLDTGTELLNNALKELRASKKSDRSDKPFSGQILSDKPFSGQILSGELVFKLYDTYGFPLDLTKLMAKEAGFEVDENDFDKRMEKQRVQAKASWKGASGSDSDAGLLMQASSNLPKTKFLGYDATSEYGKVLACFSKIERVKELSGTGTVVFDQTPFYAEGGGQVGDHGTGKVGSLTFTISSTEKIGEVFFHHADLGKMTLKEGDRVKLIVSPERRATMNNHSATHLLHAALRKVLGAHVTQAGSLVEPRRLRFDFTHPRPLTFEETLEVEKTVNQEIARAHAVDSRVLPYKEAIAGGAMALFGEKYSDEVRVIKMGEFSIELCGGTHVHNTSVIRAFKIISESGVSSGIRRIEALTGDAAIAYLMERHHQLAAIEETLKVEEGKVVDRVKKLVDVAKKLERDLKTARVEGQTIKLDDILGTSKQIKGVTVVSSVVPLADREALSSLSDKIKDKIQSGIIVLIGIPDNKGASPIVVSVTKNLVDRFHAGNLLKNIAALMDGKGGGRPDFAQGSAPSSEKATQAAQKAFELI